MSGDWELIRVDEDDEHGMTAWLIRLFQSIAARRANHEVQFEESASLAWPEYRGKFVFGSDFWPGQKLAQYQIDSSLSIASWKFGAITDSLMTPSNMLWSKFGPAGPNKERLMRDRRVRMYFDQLTRAVWSERYKPAAGFTGQNQTSWQSIGVFGNMGLWADELDFRHDPKNRGLRYRNMSPGEMYYLVDHQGIVTGLIRWFRRTAQQAKNLWPDAGDRWPKVLQAALEIGSPQLYDFLHFVRPRTDYTPWEVFTPKGKKYSSCYMCWQSQSIIEWDKGYRVFPGGIGRYMVAPWEDYGRGPMQMILATGKTKNAEKVMFLKQGQRAGDPAYLIPDAGLIDMKLHGGAFNAGGMTSDGKPLVGMMPVGDINVTREMMQDEDAIIQSAFLVNLFQLLLENKDFQMGPRQIMEYMNERGVLLAPTVGRQATEYCGPLVYRELDVLSSLGRLPPVPAPLREARGEFDLTVEWCSPLARAMQTQEVAGAMRTVEFAGQIAQMTGDPSVMDIFERDEMLRDIGTAQSMRERWFADDRVLQQKRKQRADDAERDRQVKELPGKAAIMKAQAISDKAQTGGNTGGTLSGTPQGGMPMMPGQNVPGGRAFGQPGAQPQQAFAQPGMYQ